MPYRQPPWSERYPQLLTVLEDDPGSPKGNVIRLNVVCRCKADEYWPTKSASSERLPTI